MSPRTATVSVSIRFCGELNPVHPTKPKDTDAMAGLSVALYVRVVIKMNGKSVVEHDDPDTENTGLEAPFVCCKLIEAKEDALFSIDILFGRGIRDILTSDNSAVMAIVHLGSHEAVKRLVTKKTLGFGKVRQHRLLLNGVHEKVGESRQALKRFRFAAGDKNGNITKSSIKVDLYIVKLLGQPERGLLIDTASSSAPPQTIIFEPETTKQPQAADTYEVSRLNHGHPFASFIFKYQTQGTPPADLKPEYNNENTDEDLIDLIDVRSDPSTSLVFDTELFGRQQTSATILPSNYSLFAARMESQVHTVTKLFDDLLTLDDSEEDTTEMNRLYLPLQTRGVLAEMGEKKDQAKTEDDEAISIQSIEDTKTTVCRKRKATLAFGRSSPPRPRKVIALSE